MLQIALTLNFLLLSTLSFAQLTPKKIENNDLRGKKEIFSIRFFEKETVNYLNISKTQMGEFHVEQSVGKLLKKRVKIDSDNAQKIDDQFVDKFITMKYMMEKKYKKKCKDTYTLFMRGEDLKVCKADASRMNMVSELIKLLKSKLI